MEWTTALGWCVFCWAAMAALIGVELRRGFVVDEERRPVVKRSWSLAVERGMVQVFRTTRSGGRYGDTIVVRFRVETFGALPLLLRSIEQGHPELTLEDMIQFETLAVAGVARCDRERQRVGDDCEGGR